jgi:excisionase family DNA binding protein
VRTSTSGSAYEQSAQHESNLERFLYPKREAAYLLGISPRAVDYLIADRRLKVVRIGKRTLIPREELRRFARADQPDPIRPFIADGQEVASSLPC